MVSTRPSGFTDAEEQFLQSEHAEYRRTSGREKEAFRTRCALHIIRLRGLVEDNQYILELFHNKVRNWFQNNAPVKKTRLPLSINHAFHPERVWGMKHKDDIRTGIEESRPEAVDDDAPYVVVWNAKRKEMWAGLSAEEKKIYQRLAVEWSIQGPDDDLKPEMAERRAVSWMKAVALLFWQQCRMPIFIYGCFEDTKAQLQGATFDTSLLFEDSEEWKGKPTFRSSKDWATDFRRYFYEFFTPYIRPDLASPDAMEYLRTKSKRVVEPFDFETTDEGWPLLPDADAEGWDTLRRQEVLRMWLKLLYDFACGHAVHAVPWSSITKMPSRFFAPGMIPSDVSIGDPSKIPKVPIGKFYKHVLNIQGGLLPDIPRFEFSHYETGPEGNREYPPAVNTTDVAAWRPRRATKKAQPPTFDAAPGHTDAEDDGDDEDDEAQPKPKKSSGGGLFNPGKKFYRDVEKLRKEKERAQAKKDKAAAKAKAKGAAAAKKKKPAGSKKRRKARGKAKSTDSAEDEEWATDAQETPDEDEIVDFEAVDNDVPVDESDESDSEELSAPRQLATPGPASDDSDDEVEEALERYEDVLSSSAVRKSANAVASTSRVLAESVSVVRSSLPQTSSSRPTDRTTDVQPPKLPAPRLPSTDVGNSPPPQAADKGKQRAGARASTAIVDAPHDRSASPPTAQQGLPAMPTPTVTASTQHPPRTIADAVLPPPLQPKPSSGDSVKDGATGVDTAEWEAPTNTDISPSDVPADGAARFKYLQSLDGEKAYQDMLNRASDRLCKTAAIRVTPPLFWASWGHKSPWLPKDAHTRDKGPKTTQAIMNFLKKGVTQTATPADAQRFCLVMGIMLKTIMALQVVEPGEDWPAKLPAYMATSPLTFDMRDALLNICNSVFPLQPDDADDDDRARGAAAFSAGGDTTPADAPAATGATGAAAHRSAPSKLVRPRKQRGGDRTSGGREASSSKAGGADPPANDSAQPTEPIRQAGRRGAKQRTSRTQAAEADSRAGVGSTPGGDHTAPAGARRSSRLRK